MPVPLPGSVRAPQSHANPEQGRDPVKVDEIPSHINQVIEHLLASFQRLLQRGHADSSLLGRLPIAELVRLDRPDGLPEGLGANRIRSNRRAANGFAFLLGAVHPGLHPFPNQFQFKFGQTRQEVQQQPA